MTHKRRLPWYRPRNIALAIGLILIAVVGYVVVRALTATPGNAIDYGTKLTELAKSNQPGDTDAPNRWLEYLELLEDFKDLQDNCDDTKSSSVGERLDFSFAYDTDTVDASAAPSVRADALACLDELRASDIFTRLDSFLEPAPVYQETPPKSFLMLTLYPGFTDSRALCRACVAEFHVAIEEGRDADAIRAAEHAFAVARIASHQPILIGYLVGLAEISVTLQAIRDEALEGNLSADTARELLALTESLPLPALSLGIGGEELGMLDLIQRTHTDDGSGNGMFLLSEYRRLDLGMGTSTGISTHPIANAAGFIFPDKKTTTEKAKLFYQQMRDQAAMTPYDRRNETNLDQFIEEELSRTDFLLHIALPALGSVVNSGDHVQTDLDLTRILLGLTIFRAEHNDYPNTIYALVPKYMATLPSDGYAPDGQYKYIKRTPTPEDPRAFILYSVGADFTDDDGKFVDNRDALRNNRPPMDYVVNPPSEPSDDPEE